MELTIQNVLNKISDVNQETELEKKLEDINLPLTEYLNHPDAIQCFQDEARAILDMIPFLDENFSNAVDLIFRCKGKLIVTGVGKSGHVGQKIAATLASLGTPAFFLNPLDAYHGDLGMLSSDDVLLAISYSGNTDELLRILPPVIERHIPIIAISLFV